MSSTSCLVDEYSYTVGMLAPSMIIILVLSFMKTRVRLKPELCNGRPGLPIAVDFLGKERNRLITVLAFGATASSCFNMFFDAFSHGQVATAAAKNIPKTPYGKAFTGILMTLLYGIINYPYLACLNTEYRVIGYGMGFIYTFIRCIVGLVLYLGCSLKFEDEARAFYEKHGLAFLMYSKILRDLPSVICTILLLGSYALYLYKEMKKRYVNNAHLTCREIFLENAERNEPVAEDIDRKHVSLLMSNKLHYKRVQVEHEPFYVTLKHKIYETRPDFKFSTQFLSAVLVSFIFVYQLTVFLIMYFTKFKIFNFAGNNPQLQILDLIIKLFCDYSMAAVVLACFIAMLQLFMLLRSHRSDVLKTYRTRAGLLPDERINPKMLVGKSLRFCGYQIAFTAIGMIFVAIAILFLLFPILMLKVIDVTQGRDAVLEALKQMFLLFLPLSLVPLLIWISLLLLCMFVFRDRTYPDLTVTIDNRRLYDIMSYFFFFLNILVGLWSALSRVSRGAVLGLVFLCRLDRTSMMTGYRKWDRGYMAYIGFLNVLVAFRHPVMLCFCQLLIDERRWMYSAFPARERPRVSTKALNRWFLAVMLIQNPSLVRYRKQDVLGYRMSFSLNTADMTSIVLEEQNMPIERLKSTHVY